MDIGSKKYHEYLQTCMYKLPKNFWKVKWLVPETEPVDGKNRTFLGACAEFCPVDKLLYDETNASDVQEIGNRLQRNLERCLTYFYEI